MNKSYESKDSLLQYTKDHCLRLHPVQKELIEETMGVKNYRMMTDPVQIQLIGQLAKIREAKITLDIGVFTGYSALSIAMILPSDGKVIACDIDDTMPAIGAKYWKKAGVNDKIDLRIGPAKGTLESLIEKGLAGTFDLAYIDADKTSYDSYYELCLKLLRPGGMMAIDNVLLGGSVVDPENDKSWTPEEIESIKNLNSRVSSDERVDVTMLTLGDGTSLVFKR